MLNLFDLENYLNDFLTPQLYKDYCPNGLQVEGQSHIKTLVTGVSANQALINQAAELDADVLLVHHGFFWKNENPCLTGIKQKRLAKLITNNMSLFAYHLPLDVHPLVGNNIQLGNKLGFKFSHFIEALPGLPIIALGSLSPPTTGDALTKHIKQQLHREPFYIPGVKENIETIAWCTGAAQDYIDVAINLNADAYITGEVSEKTVSVARESGIHFFAAGHHATERYGVIALGKHLADKFSIKHINIDIENPV